jgi:hypothetical protein
VISISIKHLENKNITEGQVFHMRLNNNTIMKENQAYLSIQKKFGKILK